MCKLQLVQGVEQGAQAQSSHEGEENDVRGSGDTVDTIVVHSPSMRGVAEQELDTEEPPVDSAAAPEGPASPAAADHSVSLARADGVGNTPMLDSPVVSHPLGEPSGETSVGPASPASLQGHLGAQAQLVCPR